MDSSNNLTNEKEDKSKQENVPIEIPKRRERRNAVLVPPEEVAKMLPELSKIKPKEPKEPKEPNFEESNNETKQ